MKKEDNDQGPLNKNVINNCGTYNDRMYVHNILEQHHSHSLMCVIRDISISII